MLLAPPEDGIVHVWHLALDLPSEAVAACRTSLSPDERCRADRFVQPRDVRRFTVAHAGLRRILAAYAGVGTAALRFGTGAYGKPCLSGRPGLPDLRFNLSHAGGRGALAVAMGREVGIDIEELRPLDDIEGLVRLVFSPAEHAAFAALPPADRHRAFFLCWTRKEALVKAAGRGLSLDFTGLTVGFGPAPDPAPHPIAGTGTWSIAAVEPGEPLVGTVALAGSIIQVTQRSWPCAALPDAAACGGQGQW